MTATTSTKQTPPYLQDPLFADAMSLLQKGSWTAGLDQIHQLQSQYPEDLELARLYAEMSIRSQVDVYEREENRKQTIQKILRYSLIICVLALVSTLVWWSTTQYASYIQNQLEQVRLIAKKNAEELETYTRFRDGQNLLLADRPTAALLKFHEVEQIKPDYPNLDLYIQQAEALAVIEAEYDRGIVFLEENKTLEAQEIFNRLNQAVPNYRDVSIRVEQLEKLSSLDALLKKAASAFDQEQWEDAIAAYQAIKDTDQSYQKEFVERRLYDSYLFAAQAVLDQPETTTDELINAKQLLTKALLIFPQDQQTAASRENLQESLDQALYSTYLEAANVILSSPEGSLTKLNSANEMLKNALKIRSDDQDVIKLVDTSNLYLRAVEDFQTGSWNMAIEDIETVIANNPNFAWNTCQQLLYDSFFERGRVALKAREFTLAMADFQKAIETAEMMPDNRLVRLAVQLEYVQALGDQDLYEEAAAYYQKILTEADLLTLADKFNPVIAKQFEDASTLVDIGNFQAGYIAYRDALKNISSLMGTKKYTIQEGDYLPLLAAHFHTSSNLIVSDNVLISRRLEPGMILTIRFLKTTPAP